MKMKTSLRILCVAVSSSLAACSPGATNQSGQQAQSPSPEKRITSMSVVKVNAAPVELKAGGQKATNITLKIDDGYHVNANPPSYPYLRATELELPASAGISQTSITYPPAVTRNFEFSEGPLAVYEGETQIQLTLKADPSTVKGPRDLSAKLRIQACDEQVCYAPGTIDLKIPVEVK